MFVIGILLDIAIIADDIEDAEIIVDGLGPDSGSVFYLESVQIDLVRLRPVGGVLGFVAEMVRKLAAVHLGTDRFQRVYYLF